MARVEPAARDGVLSASRRATISLEPASAYEAVTRQMVVGLDQELREIKSRLRSIDRRVADIEHYVTTENRSLAREIDELR